MALRQGNPTPALPLAGEGAKAVASLSLEEEEKQLPRCQAMKQITAPPPEKGEGGRGLNCVKLYSVI